MEVVEYPRLEAGALNCPWCKELTPAWRSGGMDLSFPHFYCDRCSNVIHRSADRHLVWEKATANILEQIASTLPDCPCGGKFRPDANPKCQHYGSEIPHQANAVQRLHDQHIILVDGACLFSDRGEPVRVRIVEAG